MVDADGRDKLTSLLAELPDSRGMTVVHVTHRLEETGEADKTFRLRGGHLVASTNGASVGGSPPPNDSTSPNGESSPPGEPAHSGIDRHTPSGFTGKGEVLELCSVGHAYGAGSPWAHPALADVDLNVRPGEGLLVVGANGSGKSTLAWILAGVLQPTRGSCLLGGRPVHEQVGSVGLAFQHARLQLQRPTVKDDLRAAGAPDDDAAAAALAEVGLDPAEFADRSIDELSGGEQRRVALAGILARRPSVIVLDEPLAGLDAPGREFIVDLLARLRFQQGLTVVVISHDLEGMERVCDRVVRLENGRVVFDGSREAASC
jgi:energy-coupling factor transport system ATP-binding protein